MFRKKLGKLPATILFLVLASFIAFCLIIFDVRAQNINGIYEPEAGSVVSGIVIIRGTADDPTFLRYELAFRRSFLSGADWIVFAQGDQPVIDDTMAIWDTTVGGEASPIFPDGNYQLRLRVVRTDYNYDEFFVRDLIVANLSQTPTATLSITGTIPITLESPNTTTNATATADSIPVLLPTLTPFPTPSRAPGPADISFTEDVLDSSTAESSGLFGQLRSIKLERFGTAFWLGAAAVAIAFVGLGVYLLLRALARLIVRRIRR